MNCNPTLTAEEFKTIHNALCEIRSVYGSLAGVVREEITTRLEKAIADMEKGLANAYKQDDAVFENRHEYYINVQTECKLKSVWSIFEVADLYTPHFYPGATKIKYGDQYTHIGVPGAQWIDLYIAANDAIETSGDKHHIFIEAFTPIAEEPGVLRLVTGS
jgi:hypothetical protein